MNDAVVIVGAGHAGGRAALALRAAGHAGRIVLVGRETHLPYERPPLSKAMLTGERALADCTLADAAGWAADEIELHLGVEVLSVDRGRRELVDSRGIRRPYDRLVLATGAAARRLEVPGASVPGVIALRDADHAASLRTLLERIAARTDVAADAGARHLVIVGAGFIGLEVAAAARSIGLDVTVVEAGAGALRRAVPPELAQRLVAAHEARGVRFCFSSDVDAVEGKDRAEAVRLADGRRLPCAGVVVGIGALPNLALAREAGLELGDGIMVDDALCTSDPSIFAIGDACAFPSRLFGRRLRLETWLNAEHQARAVAAVLTGAPPPAPVLPWFWSDQYDLTLQVAGLPRLGTRFVERRIDAATVLHFALDADGVLVGASALGAPKRYARDMRACQQLIEERARPTGGQLHDPAWALRPATSRLAEPAGT